MAQPKKKLPFDLLDKFLFGISVLSVLGMLTLLVLNYGELPDKIPMHFDANGNADRYGNKGEIWMLPVIGMALQALLWGLSRIPHTFNYAVKITEENAAKQYQFSVKMMRVLAAIIGFSITFIVWEIIKGAKANTSELNPFFLPLFIATILGTLGYFIGKSLKEN